MRPYIGITDFMHFEQVEAMSQVFTSHLPQSSDRLLHVGVMMSYKTLNGIPSKFQNAFPPKESIASIFSSEKVYNCLHYADYDNNLRLWKSLAEAISCGGVNINALQLDMVWPDPDSIAFAVSRAHKHVEVILQVGTNALKEEGDDPKAVVRRLRDYDGVIQRVLLDKSMGRGLGMDANALIPFARAIKEYYPMLGIGAAGGLGPETMHLAAPLVAEFPDLSIDAQGRLRPSGNALDPIDWTIAGRYLTEAIRTFA